MRNYNKIYHLSVDNVEGYSVSAFIYDTKSGTGTASVTTLTGYGDTPIQRVIVDTDEEIYTPIRATQFELNFTSTLSENIATFLGEDNQWLVDVFYNNELKFTGYLLTEEMLQDFQDEDINLQVSLVATDNIGLLKDIPLTKPNGDNPRGHFSLIQYVSWCLQKTELQLPIRVINSISEESQPGKTFFRSIYLQSKTFEDEINISEGCYTVLEKILNKHSYLTQVNGEWWIVRPDEFERDTFRVHSFNYDGTFIDLQTINNTKVIGLNEVMQFMKRRNCCCY